METVNVEVIVKYSHSLRNATVLNMCRCFLMKNKFRPGTVISSFDPNENLILHECVDYIIIGEHRKFKSSCIDFSQVEIKWFQYVLDKAGQELETELDAEGENVQLATVQVLPCAEYFDLWENLIYDEDIKEELLRFSNTSLLLADKKVNSNIVSYNRVVLLHGPPGTGKTSLCKALAQKLTIRLSHRFKRGFLLEINSHSLFSKWFSESGKLVTKMFSRIMQFVKDPDSLIFVLIDEIESLVHARQKCMELEPSDSIRVVNAVLTQVDQMKHYPNVLILTTSNMTEAIDLAFIDRADIKKYIGLPGPEAVYQIYYSCLQELMKAQLIKPIVPVPPVYMHQLLEELQDSSMFEISKRLFEISEMSAGLSGRTLRKIPFLALSLYREGDTLDVHAFFSSLVKAIQYHRSDNACFMGKGAPVKNCIND